MDVLDFDATLVRSIGDEYKISNIQDGVLRY